MRNGHHIGFGVVSASLGAAALAMIMNGSPRPDHPAIAHLVSKTKTICVGRFLIDLPQEAEVNFGQGRIDGFEVAAFHETREQFKQRTSDREQQIRSTPDYRGGDRNLESLSNVNTSDGLVGKIFVHGRTVAEGTQGNGMGGVEQYRDENIATEALVHNHGISIDVSGKRGLGWVDDLPRLVNQLVANPNNGIPTEPGFCMDRVYARDPLRADQLEHVVLSARLPTLPDVEFTFIVSAGLKPEPRGLLERTGDAGNWLSITQLMRFATWRAGPRTIAGLK